MYTTVQNFVKEYYEYRGILRNLIKNNLFGPYKNPLISFAWHFVLPLTIMGAYYLVFNTIRVGSVPEFWVYMSSGLFAFTFMMDNLNRGPGVVTSNSEIMKKTYFPRSMLVTAEITSSFIIMTIGYVIIIAGMLMIGHDIGLPVIMLPIILILMSVFVAGYVLFLSAINVYITDLKYLVNTLSIVFYLITPLYFTLDDVSGIFTYVLAINPFAYYVEACEQILYYNSFPETSIVAICAILPIISIAIGALTFYKLRHNFVERL